MPSPLEQYLSQIKKTLKPLPEKRRESEMLEIRQHLLHAIEVNQFAGQSVDEAVANTLAVFGSSEEMGEKIVEAWLRDSIAKKRWLAWAIVFLLATMEIPGPRAPYEVSLRLFMAFGYGKCCGQGGYR
jgi:hypothetical protein